MTAPTPDASVPNWHAPAVLRVIAENPEALQHALDAAVLKLRETAAGGDRRGILVTRRSGSLFTVEASTDVPYGTTEEKDRWRRHAPPATGAGYEAGQ